VSDVLEGYNGTIFAYVGGFLMGKWVFLIGKTVFLGIFDLKMGLFHGKWVFLTVFDPKMGVLTYAFDAYKIFSFSYIYN
jgi:hypothetical protein